jgi:hypothetical protein
MALTALLFLSVCAFGQTPANQTTPAGFKNSRFWVGCGVISGDSICWDILMDSIIRLWMV